ncbi:hypothetical protein Q4580_02530 [Bacillus thuringiensis]|nr:hypothetical protein [Bacillus thuringiensis]
MKTEVLLNVWSEDMYAVSFGMILVFLVVFFIWLLLGKSGFFERLGNRIKSIANIFKN